MEHLLQRLYGAVAPAVQHCICLPDSDETGVERYTWRDFPDRLERSARTDHVLERTHCVDCTLYRWPPYVTHPVSKNQNLPKTDLMTWTTSALVSCCYCVYTPKCY